MIFRYMILKQDRKGLKTLLEKHNKKYTLHYAVYMLKAKLPTHSRFFYTHKHYYKTFKTYIFSGLYEDIT